MAVGIAFCLKIACFWSSLLGVLASIEYVEHNVCGSGSEEPSNTCSSGIQGGDVDSTGRCASFDGFRWSSILLILTCTVTPAAAYSTTFYCLKQIIPFCLFSGGWMGRSWTFLPMPSRLIVIGDIHGGLEALTDCLVSANMIDEKWK